ncbi:zinc-binding alcohol dehydrogenase family protein [Hahella sp. KA22]|uniref:zinc-binding alcohol dehydrogenase family protein n=1 Tax=Hahella sp. KA22 TaxID=1628392 RepID=UPI000FDE5D62|nr:zinc-binding alcohol dehydrogenase family protein [Hahella sp. KA22]AZZ94935.1 zinc-binding alcohol dehydrogenase family protein [Hahella sp. KA22]QAY52579.1 zinc-binding alcohol dehydrogenase family protein [Hahella sp. KA22]
MKAIGYLQAQPIDHPESLLDITLPDPQPQGRDLLVEIKAVAVNPVDVKVRRSSSAEGDAHKVIGWDASGVVKAVGDQVSLFKPGDEVYYAGSIARPGTNSELHLVDERIVGRKPSNIGFAEAAALPLTAITAWEMLFERLEIGKQSDSAGPARLLVVGAAGGVGSIMLQLARKLTDAVIIGTASRQETRDWALAMGAHHVIDHRLPLHDELQRIGIDSVTHVASLTHTEKHYSSIVEALAPQGRLAMIDDPSTPIDIMPLKRKSLSLHWEMMFTRSLYETADMIEQHRLLNRVAELVEEGAVRTTLKQNLGKINAENLKRAHSLIESDAAIGKIVLEGF